MKKIYFFFLLLCMQILSAQFTENDIKFWVGTGSKKAFFITDFNDGDHPSSYAWGYRFDSDALMAEDMINAIVAAEPEMQVDIATGFLSVLNYNHHTTSIDDYWISWSGPSAEDMAWNEGVGYTPLVDGTWYGVAYGIDNMYTSPSTPVPAYSSEWYNSSQITNWIGTGSNSSLVIIDFGTDGSNGSAHSFVFGIRYNGSITAEQALQQIQSQTPYFNFTSTGGQVTSLSLNSHSGTAAGASSWKLFKGKDLSSWRSQASLSQTQLSNSEWLGLSFGQRLPFTPSEAAQEVLGISDAYQKAFRIYPNPASDFIHIETTDDIKEVSIYAVSGQKVLVSQHSKIDIQSLKTGVYLMEIKTMKNTITHKFIKK